MGAYICKINQYKSNDKAETGFESYSALMSFKWQENHDTSDIVLQVQGFVFNCCALQSKVVLYQLSIPKCKMYCMCKIKRHFYYPHFTYQPSLLQYALGDIEAAMICGQICLRLSFSLHGLYLDELLVRLINLVQNSGSVFYKVSDCIHVVE